MTDSNHSSLIQSRHRTWAYIVTDVTGSMVGRVDPGEIVLEHRHVGDSCTWQIFDFNKGDITGTFSGDYIGRAEYTQRGKLTAKTQRFFRTEKERRAVA